jgi:hypothetical protein
MSSTLDIAGFDKDYVVNMIVVLDRKIKMNTDSGPLNLIDQSIVAHSANKRNFVPTPVHTIANTPSGLVSIGSKVLC